MGAVLRAMSSSLWWAFTLALLLPWLSTDMNSRYIVLTAWDESRGVLAGGMKASCYCIMCSFKGQTSGKGSLYEARRKSSVFSILIVPTVAEMRKVSWAMV